jgi:PAS domain S-box-containing protein
LKSAALQRSLKEAGAIDQNMLRYVLDQSRDCIKILSPEGKVSYINSQGRCELEIVDFAAVEGKPWADLWPEGSREVIRKAVAAAQAGESSEIESSRPDSRGEDRWWRISVSPLMESDGELVGMLTISRDVSQHVRLRESEQTMALELRHRLRNAYTVASAIVMQSARTMPDSVPFAEIVCARLADVALSQTRLLEAGQRHWTMAELIRTLIEAHGDGAARIRYAGDAEAALDGHAAMLVALVIGELTNNSLKYGALRDGRDVTLSAALDGETIGLTWREKTQAADASALVPRDAGSGYSMMERMARSQRAGFTHNVEEGVLKVILTVRQAGQ